MKTNNYTDDPISPKDLDTIRKFLGFEDTNFVNQAKFCHLDPKFDFQNIDLAHVDFSNCDLRGFNFAGADLRGAFGVNVTWEVDDPIFDGADTSDSMFSHRLVQEKYFREHPDDSDLVDRLSAEYWANVIVQVDDLLQAEKDRDRAEKIAAAIFDKHKDPTVRMNILLFMRITTENSQDHKDFIFDTLTRYWKDTAVTLSGLRALNVFYIDQRDAFNWFLKYLEHPNSDVRKTAFRGAVRSARFSEGIKQILAYIRTCADSAQRRAFVGSAAGTISSQVRSSLYNYVDQTYFDFEEILTQTSVSTWNAEEFRNFRSRNESLKIDAATDTFFHRRLNLIGKFGSRFGLYFKYQKKNGAPIIELGRTEVDVAKSLPPQTTASALHQTSLPQSS